MNARPPLGRLGGVGAVVALAVLGLGLFLPGLGGFGLWEPWERQIADQAAALAGLAPGGSVRPTGPQVWLAATGMRLLGFHEGAARLPGAVLAVATLLVLAGAGAWLYGRRAGIAAALVLAATPLFVLQARQLTSDVPLLLASALSLGGLGRLAVEREPGRRALAAGIALAGVVLAAGTGGVLVGVVPPCLAFTAAWLLSGLELQPRSGRTLAWVVALSGAGLLLAALLTPYRAGQFAWLLGGTPVFGPSSRGFESAFRVLGFGLFPWSALALFAVLAPLTDLDGETPPERRPRTFLALFPVFCVVFGVAAGTLQLHLVGQVHLAVLPAVALVLGRWLAEPGAAGPANRVLGLVVATGTLLVARDLWHAPEEIASVHLTSKIAWPPVLSLRVLFLATGLVCAAAVLARLVFEPEPARPGRWPLLASRLRRASAPVLLVAALLFSAGLAHGVVPALSRHLSQKRLHDTFRALGGPERALVLYQVPRSGTGWFGPADQAALLEVAGPGALADRFREDPTLFALIPRSELAAVDVAFAEAGAGYAVADASSSRFLLLAGRLPAGRADQNPLDELRFRPGSEGAPPWKPRVPVSARYGDAVELYGADYPVAVRRPGSFPLSLYFRTLSRPPAGYKIFVHVERPGALVHGDHAPLEGAFPTERWRPGDHLRDRHDVRVPLMTASAGLYTIYVGFWPGGNTVRRLPVTAGHAHDGRDRVALGTIRVN